MKITRMKRVFSVVLALAMLIGLIPAFGLIAFAADSRTVISRVVATSKNGDITPEYGASTENLELTLETGAPAYLSSSMCGWQKYNGGVIEDCEDTFAANTYRYYVQVRIDRSDGLAYKLQKEGLTVIIDGKEWSVQGVYVFDDVSWANVYSPEFVVTIPEGQPLTFHDSKAFDIQTNFTKRAIPTFSVANNVEGGDAPYTFSKVSGPEWISVSAAGIVSGTPVAQGKNDELVIRVTDSKGAEKNITIKVGATQLSPEDRTVVSKVVGTSAAGNITPVYGTSTENLELTLETGAPAYFSSSMCGWQKYNGGVVEDCEDTFAESTYRYYAQIRIDGEFGQTHMLDDSDLSVIVDGEEWSVQGVYVFDDVSWANVFSPEFTVKHSNFLALSVKGITAPVAGETAKTSGITVNDNRGISVVSAQWYKEARFGMTPLGVSETFASGKQYYLVIEYALVEGNTVSESAEVVHDLPGGIGGHSSAAKKISITYTVPAMYMVTVTTDGNGTASASTAKAAQGTTVTLTATPNEGYEFDKWEVVSPGGLTISDNSFTMPAGNVTVNASFQTTAPTTTEIRALSATVTEPVIGGKISFEAIADGEGYTVTVEWEDDEKQLYPEDEAKFEAGKQYFLVVGFEAKAGYVFAEDATVLINGKTAELKEVKEKSAYGILTFTLDSCPITSVKLSDVTTPVIGEVPDYDVTVTGVGFSIDDFDPPCWYKYNPEGRVGSKWEPMGAGAVFSEGLYQLEVWLVAEEGFEFSEDIECFFGDAKLPDEALVPVGESCYLVDGEDYLVIYLSFTVEASGAAIKGDLDGNGSIDMDDAIYLLFHTFYEDDYPLNQPSDFDKDSDVDMDDAIYLLFHTFYEDDYPL